MLQVFPCSEKEKADKQITSHLLYLLSGKKYIVFFNGGHDARFYAKEYHSELAKSLGINYSANGFSFTYNP